MIRNNTHIHVLLTIIFSSSKIFLPVARPVQTRFLDLVKFTLKAGCTFALKAAFTEVDTRTVVTRFHGTVVYDQRTIGISVPFATFTFVSCNTIDTDLVIGTHCAYAIIDVHIAYLESLSLNIIIHISYICVQTQFLYIYLYI